MNRTAADRAGKPRKEQPESNPLAAGFAGLTENESPAPQPRELHPLYGRLVKARADLDAELTRQANLQQTHSAGQKVIDDVQDQLKELEERDNQLLLEIAEKDAEKKPIGTTRDDLDKTRGRVLLLRKRLSEAQSEAVGRSEKLKSISSRIEELRGQIQGLDVRYKRTIWKREEPGLLEAARVAIRDYFALGRATGNMPRYRPNDPITAKRFLVELGYIIAEAERLAQQIDAGGFEQ